VSALTWRAFPATWICALTLVLCLGAPVASAKVVHDEVESFKVEGIALDIAADRSGGPSGGDVYTAMFPASTVVKLSGTGEPLATITGVETPAGSFGFVQFSTFSSSGIAIDSTGGVNSGDLYVADIEHGVIDKFDEAEKFICQITATAPASSEEQEHECNGAAGSATPAGRFEPTAATVDAAGDLFVANAAHKAVDEFGPKGEFIEEVTGPEITAPTKLAVAPSGALYIVNGGNFFAGGTDVVKDSGGTFTVVESSEPRGVAVDPTTEDLYAQDNSAEGLGTGRVDEYDPTGVLLSKFINNEENQAVGVLAVGAAGQVYDAVSTHESVTIFGPDIVVPTVTVAAASAVEETTATFHGEVSSDTAHGGTEVTKCEFEYVTQAQFEASQFATPATAECAPAPPYASAQSVSVTINGLAPSTDYHYRLAAASVNNHVSYSETPTEETFATPGPPTIDAETTSRITRTEATLEAQVNPNGHDTQYEFQYGETESYGSSVPIPAADIGEGQERVPVGQQIAGLKVGTTYHYRVVAENSRGTTPGADHTFTTLPVAGVQTQLVLAGPHTATIKAQIDPKMGLPSLNGPTTCVFQYVTEAEFAASGFAAPSTAPCTPASIDAASEGQNVIIQLSGLAVDTVYDYRFVTANEAGEGAVGGTLATFGLLPPFEAGMFDTQGAPYTQAGGHPYELTTNIAFNSTRYGNGFSPASGSLKDVHVQLPMGLVGNPTAAAKCTVLAAAESKGHKGKCAPGAQVGVMHVTVEGFEPGGNLVDHGVPLFNVVPAKGVAAEFASGTINAGLNATIVARVRTGEGYGVGADSLNIPTLGTVRKVSVSIWGVPADPAHDSQRICPPGETGASEVLRGYEVGCGSGEPLKPFLRGPTSCPGGHLTTDVSADSYNAPGEFVEAHAQMPGTTNCAAVRFTPRISVTPESSSTASPTGLSVDLHVPQEENATGLSEADLKDATVTLPQGMTVNPAQAAGLKGCPLLKGKEAKEGQIGIDLENSEPASCPNASKVGSVELVTPLLEHPLKGGVYVAEQGNAGVAQGSNPFGSLLALYIAIDDPQTGVVVKLAGHVEVNAETGQLTTTFSENPQLPFEDFKLHFAGGPRAALATPGACGTYVTNTSLAPWSGNAPSSPSSSFVLDSGPGGAPCQSPGPFAPSFVAGTANNQAGASSPFTLMFSRNDGEQALSSVSTEMPPGLLGMLSKVQLCGEPQAGEGKCPSASQIGHVISSAGVGSEPLTLPEQGKPQDPVFLTGPYKGAPFGLAIVVPAEAGPFNLGTVIVRATIRINPNTSQISVVSDAMPTSLQGIPLDVRSVEVAIDREGFMFNPTDCEPLTIAGAIRSAEGATANVSSRFEAANCAALPFKPRIVASTRAATSKANGASLHVKVTQRPGEASIHKVDLQLPKVLPTRLATLQKACTEAQFATNPAGCPAGSVIGTAKAVTPVLQVPLSGPAYLVSHGGAAFPDVEYVLQADERGGMVEIVLDGKTQIKNGITYSHFDTVPDAPISSFETDLPEGPHSVLSTERPGRTDLCALNLRMPTTMVGQNGAQTTQSTKIAVSGCRAITISSRKLSGDSVTLALNLTKSGTVTVTGSGLKRYRQTLSAGAHQIKVALSKAGLALRARRGTIDLKVALRSGKSVSSATTTLRL
jgi:hypothetical protein